LLCKCIEASQALLSTALKAYGVVVITVRKRFDLLQTKYQRHK